MQILQTQLQIKIWMECFDLHHVGSQLVTWFMIWAIYDSWFSGPKIDLHHACVHLESRCKAVVAAKTPSNGPSIFWPLILIGLLLIKDLNIIVTNWYVWEIWNGPWVRSHFNSSKEENKKTWGFVLHQPWGPLSTTLRLQVVLTPSATMRTYLTKP